MVVHVCYWRAEVNMLDTIGIQPDMLDDTWVTPTGLKGAMFLSGLCVCSPVWWCLVWSGVWVVESPERYDILNKRFVITKSRSVGEEIKC